MHTSRAFKWTVAMVIVTSIGISIALTWELCWNSFINVALYHKPLDYRLPFHPAIEHADRIVIRADGFNCCGPVDETNILFQVTAADEIADVRSHISFLALTTTNSFQETCMCCGSPGMDWYRGSKRLALTAIVHGGKIRWKRFSTGRFMGIRVGYGDALLTEESEQWLREWLSSHGVRDEEYERKRQQAGAGYPPQGVGSPDP